MVSIWGWIFESTKEMSCVKLLAQDSDLLNFAYAPAPVKHRPLEMSASSKVSSVP